MACEKLARLRERYIEGDVARSRYETEKAEVHAKLASLAPASSREAEAAATTLCEFATPGRRRARKGRLSSAGSCRADLGRSGLGAGRRCEATARV
jgi:hypothetical protein